MAENLENDGGSCIPISSKYGGCLISTLEYGINVFWKEIKKKEIEKWPQCLGWCKNEL